MFLPLFDLGIKSVFRSHLKFINMHEKRQLKLISPFILRL